MFQWLKNLFRRDVVIRHGDIVLTRADIDEQMRLMKAEAEEKRLRGERGELTEYDYLPRAPYDDRAVGCSRVATAHGRYLALYRDLLQIHSMDNGTVTGSARIENLVTADFSPDGRHILALSETKLKLLDSASLQVISERAQTAGTPAYLAWLDPDRFALLLPNGLLRVTEKSSWQASEIQLIESGYPRGLAASPDGTRLFLAVNESVLCMDTASMRAVWHKEFDASPHDIAVDPRGKRIACGFANGDFAVFTADSGDETARIRLDDKRGLFYPEVIGLCVTWPPVPVFSPDGSTIAVNRAVGDLKILDSATLAVRHSPPRETGIAWIETLAWALDGRLVVGSSDGHSYVWDTSSWTMTARSGQSV